MASSQDLHNLSQEDQEDLLTHLQDLEHHPGFQFLLSRLQGFLDQQHRVLEDQRDYQELYRSQGMAQAYRKMMNDVTNCITTLKSTGGSRG